MCCQFAKTTSQKVEGYTGSVATNTALSTDTVATNKHFLLFMGKYVILLWAIKKEKKNPLNAMDIIA